jgi:hypothetical protein
MNVRYFLALGFLTLALAGCGGGGSSTSITSGGSSPPPATPSPTVTVINGVAAKGVFFSGTVKAFAIPDRLDGKIFLTSATISPGQEGHFSLNIAATTGIILLEATGWYIDEATGEQRQIGESAPLRTLVAITTPSGTLPAAVTPLTELAVRRAAPSASYPLTGASVQEANALLSDLFNVDIVATQPVATTANAFQQVTVSQQQKDYSLALAAFSQEEKSSDGTLTTVLGAYHLDLATYQRFSPARVSVFKDSLTAFLAVPTNNWMTLYSGASLATMGDLTLKLRLGSQGVFAIGSFIKGVQFTLVLPSGVTLKADGSGKPLPGVVTESGVAMIGSSVDAKYVAAAGTLAIALVNGPQGFGLGEFLTVTCDVAPGTTALVGNFSIPPESTHFFGLGGVEIPALTVVPAL